MSIEENVEKVLEEIAAAARAAGREPGEVALCAATKMNDAQAVRRAIAAGVRICGENRVQELTAKLASNAIRAGASLECAKEILNASTTDEAIDILEKYQILQKTMKEILDRIQFYLNHRSYEQILLGAVIFNNTYGYLGQTADAEKLIKLINAQNDEAQ